LFGTRYKEPVKMITDLFTVKMIADLYTRIEDGEPGTGDAGELGALWLDGDEESATYGKSWELTAVSDDVVPVYTWTLFKKDDAKIALFVPRAEADYLFSRGIAFETDGEKIVYPETAALTAAEMVCYLMGIGAYQGRGAKTEGQGDRSTSYDDKIAGYPASIVGSIIRYVSAQ
jgi:hypothetical protein